MRKGYLLVLLVCVGFSALLQSCRSDAYLTDPVPVSNQSFVEQFDTMQNAYNRGWRWVNRSTPLGSGTWGQIPATSPLFAYSSRGTNKGAAYANYLSTSGTNNGIISNWLISPSVVMQNGDKIVFYTRSELDALSVPATDYGARMQVRFNTTDDEVAVGNGDNPGKFDGILLDINPNEDEYVAIAPIPTAYPDGWTRFEATIYGLNRPLKSRFAFRYFLHGAGSAGAGNAISIDSVAYISAK